MDEETLEIVSDSDSDCCSDTCSECEEGVCTSCKCDLGLDENMYYDEHFDLFYCKVCWEENH